MFRRSRRNLILIFLAIAFVMAAALWWSSQWVTPSDVPDYPPNFRASRAAWIGIEWSMEPHTEAEIQSFASDLQSRGISDAFFYVSYLKENDQFNPTYDHAAEFGRKLRTTAPEIRLWGWVGVPIQITRNDGSFVPNRLENAEIRQVVADFARTVVQELGFDGVHLNAEPIANDDAAYLETLRLIRAELPANALLSVAAHALRLTEPITSIPYPLIEHHWTPAYLQQVASQVDQIALMLYDSGLFTPQDYRSWTAYEIRHISEALKDVNTEVLAGFSVSEEWTASHHPNAENLENALLGLRIGLSEATTQETLDGIALYPYWEASSEEWQLLDAIPRKQQ